MSMKGKYYLREIDLPNYPVAVIKVTRHKFWYSWCDIEHIVPRYPPGTILIADLETGFIEISEREALIHAL